MFLHVTDLDHTKYTKIVIFYSNIYKDYFKKFITAILPRNESIYNFSSLFS